MHASGDYSIANLAKLFTVFRPTMYQGGPGDVSSRHTWCHGDDPTLTDLGSEAVRFDGPESLRTWQA
jgi:hypothetical protein